MLKRILSLTILSIRIEILRAIDSDIHYCYSQLGKGGLGHVWSICEGSVEEEWRHSVAPIPADKLEKVLHKATDDELESTQDANILPPSGELKSDSYVSDGDDNESSRDDSFHFEKEVRCFVFLMFGGREKSFACLTFVNFYLQVEATFLRAVHENIEVANVILEVNSLRYAILHFAVISYLLLRCVLHNLRFTFCSIDFILFFLQKTKKLLSLRKTMKEHKVYKKPSPQNLLKKGFPTM